MSRFYGPGQPKINAGYQPRETVRKDQKAAPKKPVGPPNVKVGLNLLGQEMAASQTLIRFVLKSGSALELTEDSIDEVIGTWADRMCKTICGCKPDGTKVIIPVESVEYMEEVK